MKSCSCGRKTVCWCVADALAIGVGIGWPGWLLPILTWLLLIAMFVRAGLIPVRQRS